MKWNVGIFKGFAIYYCIETKLWLDSIISCFSKVSSLKIQVKLENNCNLKGKFTKLDWNGLVWKNQMEPLQFQSIFKIVMVTQSIPGLVGLIGLISPRLDWLLIRCHSLCFPSFFGKYGLYLWDARNKSPMKLPQKWSF